MKILITGGAGFIGVNAAVSFLKKGWEVTVFDNFSRKGSELNRVFLEKEFRGKVKIIQGDIRVIDDLSTALKDHYDAVLHLAAQVAVTTSVVEPRNDFDINALGTFNVLEAVRACKNPPAVLYASTNKVYGGLEHLPTDEKDTRYVFRGPITGVDESCPLDFHSPYGCSKGTADQYVHDYGRMYGLKTVVLRQSCIYGQHQMGVEDQGWVAWFIIAALLGRSATIYGNGKQVRDLLHVDDLVDLYGRAIENIGKAHGQIYNVGGGSSNTLSLLEFLDILTEDLKLTLPYTHGNVRPGDQPIFVSDNTKAAKQLGWEPKVPVREGIANLKQWLQEHRSTWEGLYVA